MTYHGAPSRSTNTILKMLVIASIIWVAYWAATGGLDQIAVTDSTASTTTTTVAG